MRVESNLGLRGFALLCAVIGLENLCHPVNHLTNRELFPRSRHFARFYFEF